MADVLERPAVANAAQSPDLSDSETRKRLSAPSLSLFFKLAEKWGLTGAQKRAILGGISKATLHNWQRGEVAGLNRDQLERVSLALGIHKGLRLLFADEASAHRWFTSFNADIPFGGRAPVEHITQGGIGDLVDVRRYIDAWRGMR